MMAESKDMLMGFDVWGRSEPIRILYYLAGIDYTDKRIPIEDWLQYKPDTLRGALPQLTTDRGTVNQSNSIARYVAKRGGLMGEDLWEELQHDVMQENISEAALAVQGVMHWKYREGPQPAKSEEQTRELYIKVLQLLEKLSIQNGKKFLVTDKIGLADAWLYVSIDLTKIVIEDVRTLTPWVTEFLEKFEADEGIRSYMRQRPANQMPKPEEWKKTPNMKLKKSE